MVGAQAAKSGAQAAKSAGEDASGSGASGRAPPMLTGVWALPPAHRTSSARCANAAVSTPPTREASAAFAAGTMARVIPWPRAARTAGRTPRTGCSEPSRASSPMMTAPSKEVGPTLPAASRTEAAIARSKPEPDLCSPAGDRLTVTRESRTSRPQLSRAERTRSLDSRTEASGSPTMTNCTSPRPTWVSTRTRRPSRPTRLTEWVRASRVAALMPRPGSTRRGPPPGAGRRTRRGAPPVRAPARGRW